MGSSLSSMECAGVTQPRWLALQYAHSVPAHGVLHAAQPFLIFAEST
jgi:hypothetical protein